MRHLLFILIPIILSGCHSSPKSTDTNFLISSKQLQTNIINTTTHSIMTLIPDKTSSSRKLRVYIEGDGKAWMRSGRPSPNPTPVNRLVHKIMSEDPESNIAYMARPCQYVLQPNCSPHTWTFGRYDDQIIESMNTALSELKLHGNYEQIELVGYSGGATIALLLATRRNDITNVRTIAGNLDPRFTNEYHKVSPMPTALNPIDATDRLSAVPQIHFYGEEDSVIPEIISKHYAAQFKNSDCIKIQSVKGANHHSGWVNKWQQLLQEKVECKKTHK